MELEAADRGRFRPERLHLALAQGLFTSETSDQRQQPQSVPGSGTLAPLQSFGVIELLSQHLHAAADGQHRTAPGGVVRELLCQIAAAHGLQIPQRLFAAGKNHRVRHAQRFTGRDPAQPHTALRLQRIQIGEVADRGQLQHSDLQIDRAPCRPPLQQIERVFRGKQIVQPRHHPHHWNARVLLQPAAPFIEQFPPASEAVDQDASDQRPFHRTQQGQGAHDLREHTAAFDVGHQQTVRSQILGQAQVGEVAPLQIHLHRTAGPFQHQPSLWPSLLQLRQAAADRLPAGTEPVAVVMLGAGGADTAATMDHLAGAVAPRLEQHRVHGAAGFQFRGPGLHRLGVGHLATIGIDPGVVAHVLPLEGQRLLTVAPQHPAERGSHQRFAGTAGGAEHHQRSGRAAAHAKGQCRRSAWRSRSPMAMV